VVLDVTGAALHVGRDHLDRPLAFELAQDRPVRQPDGVRQDVEAAAVRHAQHRLAGSRRGGDLEGLVQHRNQDVQTLERELLLAEERAAEVTLARLDLAETAVEPALLVGAQRKAVSPRLDRLPEPDPLLVVSDVLDLVGHRSAVRLRQTRKCICERRARDVDAKHRRGHASLKLRRERRHEAERVERGIADRLGAEWVEARSEVAVHAVGLHERHCRCDSAEQHEIPLIRGRARGSARHLAVSRAERPGKRLQEPGEPREGGDDVCVAALEEGAPFRQDGLGVLEVLVEQQARVAGIHAVDVMHRGLPGSHGTRRTCRDRWAARRRSSRAGCP
jgi:hypothetical protein